MLMMKRLLPLVIASVLIGTVMYVDRAYAQGPASQATKITFSKPIRLPGVTLPAGTYTFLHPSPNEDFHVVQVMNEKQTMSYGFFLTIPNERLKAANETVVTFRETPVGYLDTVRVWFFPGEKSGDEFVYSRKEAREIANAIHQPVLSMPQPGTGSAPKP
jgi:hypothetical protein